jgi:hypothetical protein
MRYDFGDCAIRLLVFSTVHQRRRAGFFVAVVSLHHRPRPMEFYGFGVFKLYPSISVYLGDIHELWWRIIANIHNKNSVYCRKCFSLFDVVLSFSIFLRKPYKCRCSHVYSAVAYCGLEFRGLGSMRRVLYSCSVAFDWARASGKVGFHDGGSGISAIPQASGDLHCSNVGCFCLPSQHSTMDARYTDLRLLHNDGAVTYRRPHDQVDLACLLWPIRNV